MKYYIETIEQVRQEDDSLVEYGKLEKFADEQSALVSFYQKLTNVANSKAHTYLNIKIMNSYGSVIKYDQLGKYIPAEVE